MTENNLATADIGSDFKYAEKLWPGFGQVAFCLLMTTSLGVAYGHAYGTAIGLVVGGTASGLVFLGIFVGSARLVVTPTTLRAGKAQLPIQYVGQAQILDSKKTRAAVQNPTQPPGYLFVRSSIGESVAIPVTDTTDPHPFWLMSSRNPAALLAALNSARLEFEAKNDTA